MCGCALGQFERVCVFVQHRVAAAPPPPSPQIPQPPQPPVGVSACVPAYVRARACLQRCVCRCRGTCALSRICIAGSPAARRPNRACRAHSRLKAPLESRETRRRASALAARIERPRIEGARIEGARIEGARTSKQRAQYSPERHRHCRHYRSGMPFTEVEATEGARHSPKGHVTEGARHSPKGHATEGARHSPKGHATEGARPSPKGHATEGARQ